MKKFILCAGLLGLTCLYPQIQAQSLKDILKSSAVKDAVTSLTGGNLKLANISAQVVLTQDELALLFNADKLLDFLGKLSAVSGSATLQAVNKLTDQYEGFKVGLQLKK